MGTEKIIKKFERKADKELEKRDQVINEESDLLMDTSKGPITRRELVEEVEPKSKEVRRQKKRSANAELNLQRATKKAKPTK
jgi:hypothetical protein